MYGIELPALVVNAINRKIEQYYISEEYKFRVEREKRESERKKIEAEGIREFQQIVSQGISDSYLRWRGIEATLQLSQSTNSKVVIIGSAKDGLPLILGNMDAPPAQGTAGAAPEAVRRSPKTRRRPGPGTKENARCRPDEIARQGSDNGFSGNARRWCRRTTIALALEPVRYRAFLSRTIRPTEIGDEAAAKAAG